VRHSRGRNLAQGEAEGLSDLKSYVIKKVLLALPIILLAILIVFLLLYLTPGDPVSVLAPRYATPEQLDAIRRKWGLLDPPYVQFWKYLVRLAHGDMGTSVGFGMVGMPVSELIASRLTNTLILMGLGLAISYSIGMPLGILAALRLNKLTDRTIMVFTLVTYAIPSFFLGLLLLLLFSVNLRWLPAEGTTGGMASIILPAMTLGLGNAALTTRMMRSSMLEVVRMDFITQLRSRGLPEREVIFKHALKNAILPVITVIGLDIGWFVGGAVVVETVFSWPGIGLLITKAIMNNDFPVVQGCILVMALFVIFGNLMADILYAYVDPRVRLG
jgi:ABC-type dipeptide/oligopeptide/nickel transport system permease component